MIKLIAIDLDGTTLKDEFTLHPYNVEVIKKYISLGYKFLIATGRPYRSSKKFYDELGLDTNKWGCIDADEHGKTSQEKIYAIGDLAGNEQTVAWAARSGFECAKNIINNIKNTN